MGLREYLYEKKDGIAYVTSNRPKVLNALNRKTVEELQHKRCWMRAMTSCACFDRYGAGEKHSCGSDISELALQTPVNGKDFFAVRTERLSFAGDDGKAVHLRDQWICAGRRSSSR